jgi:hypothetical protein
MLAESAPVWSSYSVLNVLYSLIQKSRINEHLVALQEGKSADEIAYVRFSGVREGGLMGCVQRDRGRVRLAPAVPHARLLQPDRSASRALATRRLYARAQGRRARRTQPKGRGTSTHHTTPALTVTHSRRSRE